MFTLKREYKDAKFILSDFGPKISPDLFDERTMEIMKNNPEIILEGFECLANEYDDVCEAIYLELAGVSYYLGQYYKNDRLTKEPIIREYLENKYLCPKNRKELEDELERLLKIKKPKVYNYK